VGWVYYKMGNLEQALAVFSELLAKVPEDPVLNFHAGMVLLKAGRTDEAREKLQTALAENKPFYGREDAEKTLSEIKGRG
jgi:Flp pilus assembly protein TadD